MLLCCSCMTEKHMAGFFLMKSNQRYTAYTAPLTPTDTQLNCELTQLSALHFTLYTSLFYDAHAATYTKHIRVTFALQ